MRRHEDFRLTLDHALATVEHALSGTRLLQLYDAWNGLVSALWSPAWLETTAETREWVTARVEAVQGETLARASGAGVWGLYGTVLAASGVMWHHLRLVDAFSADVPDPSGHLGRYLTGLGAQLREPDEGFSADHLFEALGHFGRHLHPPVLVTRSGASLGGDPVAAADHDLTDALTPGTDAVVVLSSGSSGGLAVVVTSEGISTVTAPSFTPEWLRRAAGKVSRAGFLDTLWHELIVKVLALVPGELPRVAWCPTGEWWRVPVLGAMAADGTSLLRTSVSTLVPDPWVLSRVPGGRWEGREIAVIDGETPVDETVRRCHEADVIDLRSGLGWADLALERFTRPRVALAGAEVGRAFFERGVPLVIGSLWDTDTTPIREALASPGTPLALARESLITLAERVPDHRAWAGVTLLGG